MISEARSRAAPAAPAEATLELEVHLWDPAAQLRFERKRAVPPRPDGAPNAGRGRQTRELSAAARTERP